MAGGRESEMKVGAMSETMRRERRERRDGERVREGRGSGVWVGRCHFRYSMEPALCEHVGNTAHTDGAIKKMMSGRRVGIIRG